MIVRTSLDSSEQNLNPLLRHGGSGQRIREFSDLSVEEWAVLGDKEQLPWMSSPPTSSSPLVGSETLTGCQRSSENEN